MGRREIGQLVEVVEVGVGEVGRWEIGMLGVYVPYKQSYL